MGLQRSCFFSETELKWFLVPQDGLSPSVHPGRFPLWQDQHCPVPLQLYDLMTMAFKYQVLLCPRPRDILLVTFNHLDAIKDFISDSPAILNQVDETFRLLIEVRI